MKKIVPFKKDIIFKTNLAEITSISLEHNLKIDEHVVKGNFTVSGEYKTTDTSRDTEPFSYDLPFSIAFDDKYKLDNAVVDIDDFYYEIINDSVLSINIETSVDKIEEILIETKEENKEEKEDREKIIEEQRCIEDEEIEIPKTNLFDSVSDKETYSTYKIYIVRENDTIESIMEKYSINKDTLELYNDLSEVKIGDKIIIPVIYEGN